MALLVAGCGGGGSKSAAPTSPSAPKPAAAGPVLNVVGTEYSLTPSKLMAAAGQTTIRFTNKGAMEHDITIDALHIHLMAQPGKTSVAIVTLKPGTYQTFCAVAGHMQSGMRGTLTVS